MTFVDWRARAFVTWNSKLTSLHKNHSGSKEVLIPLILAKIEVYRVSRKLIHWNSQHQCGKKFINWYNSHLIPEINIQQKDHLDMSGLAKWHYFFQSFPWKVSLVVNISWNLSRFTFHSGPNIDILCCLDDQLNWSEQISISCYFLVHFMCFQKN